MDNALPMPSDTSKSAADGADDPQEIIARYFAEMDALRDKMRRSDVVIAKARTQTREILEEIALALAELKAA